MLELGLVAADHVELQPELPEPLGGVGLGAHGRELATLLERPARARSRSIAVSMSWSASSRGVVMAGEA